MLSKVSFLFLNAFLASCFFSPTLRSICLVAGQALWLLPALKDLFSQERRNFLFDHKIGIFNYLVLALILTYLFIKLAHGGEFLTWAKSLFVSYLQWFWMSALVFTIVAQKSSNKFLKFPSRSLSIVVMLTSSLLSLLILLQFFKIVPMFFGALGILDQAFTNSGLIAISFYISIAFIEQMKFIMLNRALRILLFASAVIQLAAILVLGQISVWVGMIASLIFYVLFSKLFNWKQLIIAIATLLLAFTFTYNLSPRIQRKFKRLTSVENLLMNKSMQCRFHIWQENFDAWLEKPVLGINKIIPYQCVYSPHKTAKLSHAHSIYLQKLYTGGLLRFTAWLAFYFAIGCFLFSGIKYGTLPFFCGYFALSIEGLFENWWGDTEVLSLFVLMFVLAMRVKETGK